jgi:hypothetical protein
MLELDMDVPRILQQRHDAELSADIHVGAVVLDSAESL